MKKKLRVALLCLLATVSLVSCKDDKEENETPVAPVIGVSHTIAGKVIDKDAAVLSDVTVALSGVASAETKTDSKGEFTFNTLTKAGDYTVTLTKAGKFTTTAHVTIEAGVTKGISKNVNLQMVDAGTPQTIQVGGGAITTSTNVTFTVPENAITKAETITITPINDIVTSASEGKKALPLMTISCAPAKLTFEKPCPIEIPNALTDYSFSNVKLLYFKDGAWTNENMAAVTSNGATYATTISHFSSYQIAFETEVKGEVASNENLPAIESIDNLNGKGDVKVENVSYTMKSGYEFVITPAQALATAGVTGDDLARLETLITDAIVSKNGGIKPALADVKASYAVNTTIPKGVRFDISGSQKFNTITYQVNLKKGAAAQIIPVTISVKAAGAATITTKTYTKEHQGGTAGQ